jgi:hypothetical protein
MKIVYGPTSAKPKVTASDDLGILNLRNRHIL